MRIWYGYSKNNMIQYMQGTYLKMYTDYKT